MNAVVWVSALLAAAIHVLVFVWEALLLHRPAVHRGVFGIPATDVPAVRLWAFGVGFYNLFLAAGMVTGLVLWQAGDADAGRALVVYVSTFMVLGGVVLFVADRMALGREKGKGISGSIAESGPALVALVAAVV